MTEHYKMNRRQFISTLGMAGAGLVLGSCKKSTTNPPADSGFKVITDSNVAIAQNMADYSRTKVKAAMQEMFEKMGGLSDIIHSGDKVAIKINLTGGVINYANLNPPPYEYYLTHPEVVRAAGELIRDAGASELYIVESLYNPGADENYQDPHSLLSYQTVADELGAEIINLNQSAPYNGFVEVPVNEGSGLIYDSLMLNGILTEIDGYVSIAKMKNHVNAGVTHSLKNQVGILPLGLYTQGGGNRSAIHNHGTSAYQKDTNLVRVVLDINRARPVNLAIIDGIKSASGGEGPWISAMTPALYHVLLASKDPVAADAIATKKMGLDPEADAFSETFPTCINYLQLARQLGMGTY